MPSAELLDKALEYQRIGQLAVNKVHEELATWVKCVRCGKSFPSPGIHTCKIPHKDVNDDSK